MEPEEIIIDESDRVNDRLTIELYKETEITPEKLAEHLANISEE